MQHHLHDPGGALHGRADDSILAGPQQLAFRLLHLGPGRDDDAFVQPSRTECDQDVVGIALQVGCQAPGIQNSGCLECLLQSGITQNLGIAALLSHGRSLRIVVND